MEKIKDLLEPTKNNLKVREDKIKGLYIEDLSERYVINDKEVLELIEIGTANRAVAYTNMNSNSSRSHLVFILTIHQKNTNDLSSKLGKLYLVDLAGSEKMGKTGYQTNNV
jgi:kinesin family protein 5